jgi:hypothetical protein
LRIAAETVACCSIAFSTVFFMVGPFYSERSGFAYSFFFADAKPYVVVAVAALLARTRGPAAICVAAALCVLAVGIYTYVDWIRVPYINDIDLFTFPLKWLFAAAALLVSGISLIVRLSHHVPDRL